MNAANSSAAYQVPVGLFGLARYTSLVRGPMLARKPAKSWPRGMAFSRGNAGAGRNVAPAACAASAYTAKPNFEATTSSPGPANTCANCINSSCEPLPSNRFVGLTP